LKSIDGPEHSLDNQSTVNDTWRAINLRVIAMYYIGDKFGFLPNINFPNLETAKYAAQQRANDWRRTIYVYHVSKIMGRFEAQSAWIRM
jgi:hypothetical protein